MAPKVKQGKPLVSEPRMKKAANLRAQMREVPVWDMTSVALLVMGLRKMDETRGYHDTATALFGCVACGDSTELTTHVVEGYGALCAGHADGEARAKPLPWAEEFTVLGKRGLRL